MSNRPEISQTLLDTINELVKAHLPAEDFIRVLAERGWEFTQIVKTIHKDWVIGREDLSDTSNKGRPVYPWMSLTQVGMFFDVYDKTVSQMSSAAGNSRPTKIKYPPWKFSCRQRKDAEGKDCIRVTRVQ